jgi:alpha-tubulin suppressor-like RCC1 family protein
MALGALVILGLVMPALGADASTPSIGVPNKTPGTVWTWGDGNLFNSSLLANPVHDLSDVVEVGVGGGDGNGQDTGYALREDGTVWAWGVGGNGELGTGTNVSQTNVLARIHGLSDVVEVAGGYSNGYALEKDGTVWAWGVGADGQLGNGTNVSESNVPVRVKGLSGVVAVVGGYLGGYAVEKSGRLWAWGAGSGGVLGNGTNVTESDVPVQVKDVSDVVAVAGGFSGACALEKNGTVWAWGAGESGQLGNGTNVSESDVPFPVHALSGVVAIAAFNGDDSYIALRKDGSVWHWGAVPSERGGPSNDVPAEVRGLTNAVAITAGYDTEFALLKDGTVWGWGDAADGEMGNGTQASVDTAPIQVHGVHGAVAIAGGIGDEYAIVPPS